ncbi:hypothetical protein DSL72_006968 [Monilinia vaccinii-corymbosi]|uniref:Alpha/beta hydrolase fold-3 domain-containing protein n=1 Tax=Monilinia vaccinii-corymbosi TaxID=61207 RepID=A0A8A3PLV7_9HELO|nr:hypothetical protein DSL72_006968 [Monilinia vaccinii-corymbosi]
MSSSTLAQKKLTDTLSVAEKLDLVLAYASILGNTFLGLLTGLWRTRSAPRGSYRKYVLHTAVRTMCRRMSPRQLLYAYPNTDHSYHTVCKKRGIEPLSETLEDGTQAHWIGKKGAKKIVLNFHGGGFVLPASPESFEFLFKLVDGAETEGKSLAVLFLSYDLSPSAVYPRQLEQAAALLNHVIHNLNYPPSSIILAGDSAGANLVLALLSHIIHGHPNESIPRVQLKEPLDGAVLLAPWLTFGTSSKSYEANRYKDLIDPIAIKLWSRAFQSSTPSDNYIEPLYASTSWWKRLPTAVTSILILTGENEVFVDDVKAFAGKLQEVVTETGAGSLGLGLDLKVVEDEYHDQPNFGFGEDSLAKEKSQGWEIGKWVTGRC